GTNEEKFNWSYPDNWAYKAGVIAENTRWAIDEAKGEGTIIWTIRQGIHWALNPKSEASRLVNGRELTADDVVYSITSAVTDTQNSIYRGNPELKTANITKTGPWEVTLKIPLKDLVTAVMRLTGTVLIYPPEVVAKYGKMSGQSVGTGPFILSDYIPSSQVTYVRNTNYWDKDPVGPGKGNQLPYLDSLQSIIIPDVSTQQAALRTGKIDQMGGVKPEDVARYRQTTPELVTHEENYYNSVSGIPGPIRMRTDKPPFNDIRVRRAMTMAIDFKTIDKTLGVGRGRIITYPYRYVESYNSLYLTLEDPDMPASVKELFTYSPDKARQLLKEAGFPNGLKTHMDLAAAQVDYASIYKDYWSKVGIDVDLTVKDSGTLTNITTQRSHDAIIFAGGQGPPSIFWAPTNLQGESSTNLSMINDPVINDGMAKIRLTMVTENDGYAKAMKMARELNKYVYDQAYIIPTMDTPTTTLWWPWLKNYTGEISVGYGQSGNWEKWVWIDEALKKSLGY
ncbi:MAG: hypothetical protein A2Z02_05875, partial [Chloroflexi bacterium RBG_16_48_7]